MLDWLPENISSFGHDIDGMMYLIYYVVGAWLILVEGILIWFLIRYRKRADRPATHQPGKTPKALAWVFVPATLVFMCDLVLDAKGSPAWEKIKIDIPEKYDALVRIEGRQFAWNFRHAGKDMKLDTPDDIVTNGQLHVPVGKIVRFELISRDVLHSFWVPNLRLKQDAVPGRTIPGWFDASRVGSFGIGCAELCGSGHGVMSATLIVESQTDYEKFLSQ